MQITKIPERTAVAPFKWGFEDLFTPWFEDAPRFKTHLPEVFRRTDLPALNVSETDKLFTVTVDLPGLEEKDIEVKLMGNQLGITAERKWDEEKKGREFHRVESQYGMFERNVMLPENLKLGAGEATYKKGVLAISFPKVEPTPAAKIKVTKGD